MKFFEDCFAGGIGAPGWTLVALLVLYIVWWQVRPLVFLTLFGRMRPAPFKYSGEYPFFPFRGFGEPPVCTWPDRDGASLEELAEDSRRWEAYKAEHNAWFEKEQYSELKARVVCGIIDILCTVALVVSAIACFIRQ